MKFSAADIVTGPETPLHQGKRMTFAVNIVNDEVIIITTSIIVKNYQ